MTARDLPTLNALLNGTAAVLLLLGWLAVKRGQVKRHRAFMIAALVASALFLTSYVTYHYIVPGPTRYQGEGFSRYLYFAILLTHTPLATLMVPFILAAVWFAYRGRFDRHVRITRILWPTWMYVSVTGVLIYLMLYVL
jgi:putative membrane protein